MRDSQVFLDPSGRRWRRLKHAGLLSALAAAVGATLFTVSLLVVPLLPKLPGVSGPGARSFRQGVPFLPNRQERLNTYLLRKSRSDLWREIRRAQEASKRKVQASAPPAEGIVAAFYAPWQETGLHSLRANAGHLTHVMPEWLHMDRSGGGLDTSDWDPAVTPHNLDVVQIAREHHVQVHPILNNAEGGVFDPVRAHALLSSPEKQRALALAVRDWLVANRFPGLNLDIENLSREDYAKLPAFAALLGRTLRTSGLSFSADVEAMRREVPLKELAALCDFLVLMAYDEHYEGGQPGPIASADWAFHALETALKSVPPSKLVLGIGNYAYDWTEGKTPAESISYQSAIILARDNHPDERPETVVDFDEASLNTTFTYEDDGGLHHEVWILDGISAYNQWLLARQAHPRGAALWALGSEDPSVWDVLDRRSLFEPKRPHVLEKVSFPYEIEFEGDGEILSVIAEPQEGLRRISADGANGLITDVSCLRYPTSLVIKRSGYQPNKLALTFDDGPDSEYTPQVLDILKAESVKAAFFVIGENAEREPELIRREWREGHEIGNHTFTHPNMGGVGRERAVMEMNATQRAIQGILGRSTILFRAPYNADAEPVSAEEVRPIQVASELGYVTVGELIDPQDWNLRRPGPGGEMVRRTPEDLVQSTLKQLKEVKGNAVLLHDGGGDRSHTVEALKVLIPELRRAGYSLVTVSELVGRPRDAVMVPVQRKDQLIVGVDRVFFETLFTFETLLRLAFIAAIFLGIGRVLLLVPMALLARLKARRATYDASYEPEVSVLIAAYNERPVIAKTIQCALAGEYPIKEVIVVDDGSKDGTAEEVLRAFSEEPRVKLLRQENAGKAAALNRAVAASSGEILVCLDADTQVGPRSVGFLARHFFDAKVAAVAGNVKVGNRVNLLTQWQAIEYVTTQNLDRRAYALLNAITVVPGAVGAWRKSALLAVGGYLRDSMAEDTDLTWRLRRAGWRVGVDEEATGLTEVPDTLRGFFRQRFRWTYGTLQCLWKHKGALLRYGWFGRLALPMLWLFQVVFQVLAPLTDLQVLYNLALFFRVWMVRGLLTKDWQPLPHATHVLLETLFFYALFFVVELLGALVAFLLDREKLRGLWWLFFQRLVYRQIMYGVLLKSLVHALRGAAAGWGKVERKGTVVLSKK